MSSELWSGFRLGDRWVRPDVNKIDETRIDAKVMEVLVALAEVSPSVMSPSALLARVWPNVVVVDNVVYQAIAQLRKALGDSARSPSYIECISRRGYRVVAPINAQSNGAAESRDTRHNLPEELTSFIGRESELGELHGLLKQRRMITLTGVGGCGKTRLALSIARACVCDFPDGVWLVDFAPLSDASQVVHAVAKSLHIRESPGKSLHETVLEALRGTETLLIFDNGEHVIDACARLSEALLQRTPGLKILATSREGIGIGAEQPWPVQPLTIPTDDEVSSIERLATVDSVRLLVERARVVDPAFTLTAENSNAVAEICRRLDGLPFAIELAAARMRDMHPEQIRVRLHDRFRLLAGGSRTALPRQRTLQATLDWSHQLLSEDERKLLRRLAVFVGDFSVEAAISLGDTTDERERTFERLTRLVDQSMVRVDSSAGRYRMLETVRQYANDRLVESGEIAVIRDRHRDFYVALAEQLQRDVEAGNWQSAVFDRFSLERANFEAVLEWCLESDAVAGLRLALKLRWFWLETNLMSSMHWFEDFLSRIPESLLERPLALRWAGSFHMMVNPKRAKQHMQEALKVARTEPIAPAVTEAALLLGLAEATLANGESDDVQSLLEQVLALSRSDRCVYADLLMGCASCMLRLDFPRGEEMLSEAVRLLRDSPHQYLLARALHFSSQLAFLRGEVERTRVMLEEAMTLSRVFGNRRLTSDFEMAMSTVAESTGNNIEAVRLMEACEQSLTGMDVLKQGARAHLGRQLWKIGERQRGLEMLRSVLRLAQSDPLLDVKAVSPNTRILAVAIHSMSQVACDLGDHIRAARLYGAHNAMIANATAGSAIVRGRHFEGVAEVLRASMGDRSYEAEIAAGASMAYEDVVRLALSDEPPIPQKRVRESNVRALTRAPRSVRDGRR